MKGPGWIVAVCLFVVLACGVGFAGGPLLVGSNGIPQTWANGVITYFTDQGDLSPLLPSAQADQFVADAWSQWTSVPRAALTVSRGGQLDEDVSGANFALSSDIEPTSSKTLAIVYDADGTVMDALLGEGAGAAALCSTNAVLGEVDRISDDGHIAHALVVINGNCALTAANLPVLHYQLVRVFGRILGLDYSQLNENVVTGVPAPSGEDYAGYPVMHPLGVVCSWLTGCLPNADAPRMDDRAALGRLYPSSAFTASTARAYGTVRFPDWEGPAGQGMQGVNVVARLIDPTSGRVSTEYTASCVSGFRFRGNAGNPMTGYLNALGERWDEHGSADPALEGFYDLAGLEIPQGYNAATYELTVEPMNPLYNGSTAVGPYVAGQVGASGSAPAVRVTIAAGAEVAQDFVMQGAVSEPQDRWEPSSFAQPRPMPLAGSWSASLSGYGDRDYYSFYAQANRTFTFDVTAIDKTGAASVNKALPVLGVWAGGDAEDAPELSETYFNTEATATTRLQVVVGAAGTQTVGVADYRGDGRPDFRYTARMFYADQLLPARVGVQGGSVVTIEGFGFTTGTQVSVGGAPVTATMVAANQIVFRTPALSDGTYTVLVTDPATGASSQMNGALAVGSVGAKLVLLNGANPQVPVGTVAPNAVLVQVMDSTAGTPVAGATVLFAVPATAAVVGCSASPCPVITDQDGLASAQILVQQPGASIVTASLPTGGLVSATVNGVAATLEITLAQPTVYVGTGSNVSVPVSALVVGNGVPVAGTTVNFLKNYGTATISPASSITGPDGMASSLVTVSGLASDVNISACVAPGNAPCRALNIDPVTDSSLRLQKVSGDAQSVAIGQNFAPLVLRVTDTMGNPVIGVPVMFDVHVNEATTTAAPVTTGEVVTTHTSDPVTLSSSMVKVVSDASGLVTLSGIAAQQQPVQVMVRATTGQTEVDMQLQSIWMDFASNPQATRVNAPIRKPVPISKLRAPHSGRR